MQKTKLLQLTFIALAESFSLKDHEEAQVKITIYQKLGYFVGI